MVIAVLNGAYFFILFAEDFRISCGIAANPLLIWYMLNSFIKLYLVMLSPGGSTIAWQFHTGWSRNV
jgi:hypothetical protein